MKKNWKGSLVSYKWLRVFPCTTCALSHFSIHLPVTHGVLRSFTAGPLPRHSSFCIIFRKIGFLRGSSILPVASLQCDLRKSSKGNNFGKKEKKTCLSIFTKLYSQSCLIHKIVVSQSLPLGRCWHANKFGWAKPGIRVGPLNGKGGRKPPAAASSRVRAQSPPDLLAQWLQRGVKP